MRGWRRAVSTRTLLRALGAAKGSAGKDVALTAYFGTQGSSFFASASAASTSSASLTVGSDFDGSAAAVATARASFLTEIEAASAGSASAAATLTTRKPIASAAKAQATAIARTGVGLRRFGTGSVLTNLSTQFLVTETLNQGELLLVYVYADQNPVITPVEPGWTVVSTLGYGGSPSEKLTTWRRVAETTGTFTYTFTLGTPTTNAATNRVGVAILAGVDPVDPVEYVRTFESGASASTAQSTPATPPTIYPGDGSFSMLALATSGSLLTGPTPAVPSGDRDVFAISGTGLAEAFFAAHPAPGATPAWSTTTSASTQYLAQTLIIHAWGSSLFASNTTAQATAALTPSSPINAAAAAEATASGALSVQTNFTAAAAAVATATAFLQPTTISGDALGTATATGDLTAPVGFRADAIASAAASLFTTPPADLAFIDNNFPTVYSHFSTSGATVMVRVAQSNAQLGDLILLTMISDAVTVTPVESGWVQIGTKQPLYGGASTSRFGLFIFYCKDTRSTSPGSGVPISYTFTLARPSEPGYSGWAQAHWGVQRWRNANFATPIRPFDEPIEGAIFNYPTFAISGSSGDVDAPSVSAQHAKDVLVGMWAAGSPLISSGSGPAGITETRNDLFTWTDSSEQLNYEYFVGYKALATTGPTGDQRRTWTTTAVGSDKRAAVSLLLRYQGAGTLLRAAPASAPAATGSLTTSQEVAAASSATAAAWASLSTSATHSLAGTSASSASAASALTTRQNVAADAEGQASCAGELSVRTQFAGAGEARFECGGALTTEVRLAGEGAALAVARVRDMLVATGLSGAAVSAAAAAAELLGRVRLTAAAECRAYALGVLGPFRARDDSGDLWVRSTPKPVNPPTLDRVESSTAYDP